MRPPCSLWIYIQPDTLPCSLTLSLSLSLSLSLTPSLSFSPSLVVCGDKAREREVCSEREREGVRENECVQVSERIGIPCTSRDIRRASGCKYESDSSDNERMEVHYGISGSDQRRETPRQTDALNSNYSRVGLGRAGGGSWGE